MRRLVLLCCAVASTVTAQSSVPADVTLHGTAGGSVIATLPKGSPIRTGATRSGWTQVTIEGWVASSRLGTRRDTLDRSVTGESTAPLRAQDGPRQPIVATLEPGTYLRKLSERNGWTRVRRTGWVRSASLRTGGAAADAEARTSPPARSAPPRDTQSRAVPPAGPGQATDPRGTSTPTSAAAPPPRAGSSGVSLEQAARATSLLSAPGGAERAALPAGSPVEILGRDRGWVRVRVEGWLPEADVEVAAAGEASRISATDLRADPERFRGAVVRWEVDVIALQRADVLRKGFAPNEPYLLLRGPAGDASVTYAAVPPSLLELARGLRPMSRVIITARVREGRSEPVGIPVLDLQSIALVK